MTRGKRDNTLALRVDDAMLARLDRYQRDREAEARVPLSRGLILLEIVETALRERETRSNKIR